MPALPAPLQKLTAAFGRLPGVGPKTAARYAYHVLTRPQQEAWELAAALNQLHRGIYACRICSIYSENNPCNFCTDEKRLPNLLCVVATSRDAQAVESSGSFHGRYHILGGVIDALYGLTSDRLAIKPLLSRIHSGITEIILAFNPDIPGEATALYLSQVLAPTGVRLTKLARGLQTGADLEYVDPLTLGDALDGRREISQIAIVGGISSNNKDALDAPKDTAQNNTSML